MKKLFIALLMAGVLVSVDAFAAKKNPCPAGTYGSQKGATSAAACLKCTDLGINMYQDGEGKSTCKKCGSGKIANAEGTDCIAGCLESQFISAKNEKTGSVTCSSCPRNATCDGVNFTCATNAIKKNNQCYDCPTHASCSNGNYVCAGGYYEAEDANKKPICKQCEEGFYCSADTAIYAPAT